MTSEPPAAPSVEETNSRRTAWTGLDVFLVFLLGLIGAVVVGTLAYPLLDRLDLTETTIETIFTLLTYASIAAVAFVIVFRVRKARAADVGFSRVAGATLFLMIPAAFAVMVVNGFLVLLIRELFGNVATVEDQLNVGGETLDAVEIFFFYVTTVVAAPLVEEFVFRGLFYRFLRGRINTYWAMAVSAALFSALHLIPSLFAPLFFLGLALAYVSERYDSLYPAMVMHAVVNLTAITLLVLGV